MEYNTSRKPLIIGEYGRHIQKLIDHAITLEDRDERNKIAQAIVAVMGQMNPQLRDVEEYKHKLWDHLFIMSDFKLDVDSPYNKPMKQTLHIKPQKVNYPTDKIKHKHYGKILEIAIEKIAEIDDDAARAQYAKQIANFMKHLYLNYNRDTVTDDIIFNDLEKISKGKLTLDPATIQLSNNIQIMNNNPATKRGKQKKQSGRGGKRRR